MYFTYMIKNSIGKPYIGVTKDPQSRLTYHNERREAKFTKYKTDFKIVFQEHHNTLAEAQKREIQLKKWRREKKEILIERYGKGLPTVI